MVAGQQETELSNTLTPEDKAVLADLVGVPATTWLENNGTDITRNSSLEQGTGNPAFQFELGGRIVTFSKMEIPNSWIKHVNPQVTSPKNTGILIDFYLKNTELPIGERSHESHTSLQEGSIQFMKDLRDWVHTLDDPLVLAPSDERRFEAYERYFKNEPKVPVYLIYTLQEND